jgi:hypothetical protein
LGSSASGPFFVNGLNIDQQNGLTFRQLVGTYLLDLQ